MAFAGALARGSSVHAAAFGRGFEAGKRDLDGLASAPVCFRGQAEERMPGACSTSGRPSLRSAGFRRRATVPLFAETGHEDFYTGVAVGKRGLGRAKVLASAAVQGDNLMDIYARARDLGAVEEGDASMPSQEDFRTLSMEVKEMRGRLDSMEKAMRKMKDSSSSSSSSSSSESSSSDDGRGKSVKKALKQEAKRRKADRKAAGKELKGLRARTGALMMDRMGAQDGLQREAAAVGVMTGTDMLRVAAAGTPTRAGKLEVCMSGKCRKYGGMNVLQAINAALPVGAAVEATACKCLGKCGSGPNVKVRPDGGGSTLHTHVEPNDVEALLWRHFGLQKNGQAPPSPRIPVVAPATKMLELVS